MTAAPPILLNGAFRGQRITGQQRYATELAHRLLQRPDVGERRPRNADARGALSSWAWAMGLAVTAPRDSVLITLTSRGPIASRRHLLAVHDLFVLEHPEWYSAKYLASHVPVLKLQLRTAAGLVTVSEPVAEQLRHHIGGRLSVVVVPNAAATVFDAQPQPVDEQVLSEAGVTAGQYFLSVGDDDPRKNVRRLAEAHESMPPDLRERYPLILVGGRAASFATTDRPDALRRLGYVDDPSLAALYRHATAVVFPSLDEGFGLPAVEAMACGAPLVTSDIPVLRWVCGETAILVDPLDVGSIREGLERAASAAPTELARDERVRAARRFSWESSAATLHDAATALR